MSYTQNSEWLEAATDNFNEAISQRNWPQARVVVADIEGYGFDAGELRRTMNLAMFDAQTNSRDLDEEDFEMMDSGKLHNMQDFYDRG